MHLRLSGVRQVICNLVEGWRKASEVFAKVLADGTIGLLVDLRLSAVRQVDFFAKLFWTKKRVFGYFFQKVTLLIKSILICS